MATEYFVLTLGQSNRNPKENASTYLAAVPDMNVALTGTVAGDTYHGKAHEQIRFLTFYNSNSGSPPHTEGYPTDPIGNPPPASFVDASLPFNGYEKYCKWQPWSLLDPATNPADDGFDYPNHQSFPQNVATPYSKLVGIDIELARLLMGWTRGRVNIANLAVDATQLQHQQIVMPLTRWAWFNPNLHSNWSPADPKGLFGRLSTMLDGLVIASELEGTTMRCLAVCCSLLETESTDERSRDAIASNIQGLVDGVRALLASKGLLDVAPAQVPFIWPKIPTYPWADPVLAPTGNVSDGNTALDNLAKDDLWFGTYDTNGAEFVKKSGDPLHWGVGGIRASAAAEFALIRSLRVSNTIAMRLGNVPSLSSLRTEVKRLAYRNVSTAVADDDTINEAINDCYMDMVTRLGDTAWFLRQVYENYSLSSAPDSPIELPRRIERLIEIRPMAFPHLTIDFSMLGHSDEGRVRIITLDIVSDSVGLHHMHQPRRLVADDERPAIPAQYVEALKYGAAKRLAFNSGNRKIQAILEAQWRVHFDEVFIHCNKVDRQRRERLTGRRRTRYRSQWGGPTFYPWRS